MLQRPDVDGLRVINQGQPPLGGQQFDDVGEVLIGLRQAGDQFHLGQPGLRAQRLGQGLAVVDHVVRPQFVAPLHGFRARGGSHHAQLRQLPRQLDQHGANTACAAHNQQRLLGPAALGHTQAVKQQLPGGDGGQRQGSSLRIAQAARGMGGDAGIDQLPFAIAAGAVDGTGVVHAVAHGKAAGLGAQGLHRAHGIPAQHARLASGRRGGAAHLGVDGIDRYGLHAHQQIVRAGVRLGQFNVLQGSGIGGGQAVGKGDGFHGFNKGLCGTKSDTLGDCANLHAPRR